MINKSYRILKSLGIIILLTSMPTFAEINFSHSRELVIPVGSKNKIIGVRVADLVSNTPNIIPGLVNINATIKKSPSSFFNQGTIEVIHDVFLNELPEVNGDIVKLSLVGFVKYKNQTLNFEKILVSYNTKASTLAELNIQSEVIYPLKDMLFKVSVGLVDRKVIIEDSMKDIKIVFPIGVGAFDEGVMNEDSVSLVTPRFKNGFIDQRAVVSKREKPRYFAGKPFIRILKGNDLGADATAIGFHIEINDSFVRGFDSHGCMRLREQDLMAFHDLIMFGNEQKTPITIQYRTEDLADHPAPKRNNIYKTILNAGKENAPFFIYDKDNLVQMVYRENRAAPIDKLKDLDLDNYYELFSYETAEQMKEQNERRKNECDTRVMSGELNSKKIQECLDLGKRKDSLKDKIYRKYMGIDD